MIYYNINRCQTGLRQIGNANEENKFRNGVVEVNSIIYNNTRVNQQVWLEILIEEQRVVTEVKATATQLVGYLAVVFLSCHTGSTCKYKYVRTRFLDGITAGKL